MGFNNINIWKLVTIWMIFIWVVSGNSFSNLEQKWLAINVIHLCSKWFNIWFICHWYNNSNKPCYKTINAFSKDTIKSGSKWFAKLNYRRWLHFDLTLLLFVSPFRITLNFYLFFWLFWIVFHLFHNCVIVTIFRCNACHIFSIMIHFRIFTD